MKANAQLKNHLVSMMLMFLLLFSPPLALLWVPGWARDIVGVVYPESTFGGLKKIT